MNIQYKRAWVLVDEINRACGRVAVKPREGGKHGGGTTLTPFGLSLVGRNRKIERLVGSEAHKELLALSADIKP